MTTRKLWIPVLAALLVMALVGPGMVGAVEPRATHTITIPAGAFIPHVDGIDYTNQGYGLWTMTDSGTFTAPVPLPEGVVTVTKMTLFVEDNGGDDVSATLYRTTPGTGGEDNMGMVQSSGASSDPRYFSTTTFGPAQINNMWYGPYLWVYLPGSSTDGYRFYGVRITYTS